MSFRLKAILGLALVEAVLLAILVASAMRFLEVSGQKQLDGYARSILGGYIAMTRNELSGGDLAHMKADTDVFVADSGLVYARIRDGRGRMLVESAPRFAPAGALVADDKWAAAPDAVFQVGQPVRVGEAGSVWVELGIDVSQLQGSLAEARRWNLAIAGVGIAVVTLFSMALGVHLTRRLADLQEGARRLHDGELGYQVPTAGRDELSETAQVFNVMSRQLSYQRDKAAQLEQERETERMNQRQQLERLVAARTAELFEIEAQASLILESSAAGLCGIDRRGRITFINPAACEMLGYSHDLAIGADARLLWHGEAQAGPPYLDREFAAGAALRQGKATVDVEEVFRHADGHPIQVILSSHPLILGQRTVGAVLSFVDITERKRMEHAQEAALREAERLAQVKSAFLANMSHEIRTPLNAVLGMAQLGLRESRLRKAQSRFASILDAGQLLSGLVNDILDFSKIEAGKLQLEHGPVALGRVVDRAVDLTAARAWAKGLSVVMDVPLSLPEHFLGDELRIVQVLVNLLSNAVKFTDQGGICFSVEQQGGSLVFTVTDTGIGMTEDQMARLFTPFEQADGSTTRRFGGTGLGLAISKRLADLMAGTIEVRSRPGDGTEFAFRLPVTGLEMPAGAPPDGPVYLAGLACADTLSEALGRGGIGAFVVPAAEALAAQDGLAVLPYPHQEGRQLSRVREALASGRRVALVVPPGGLHAIPADLRDRLHLLDWPARVRHIARALTAAPPEAEAPAPIQGECLSGIRVLAAEDNELNQAVLREMLTMAGASTVCVENGRDLVERLRQDGVGAYDVVITDVQMPDMDGYQAARVIRGMSPDLPVLGLTAHVLAEERARCLASGMSAHIGKPVDLDALIGTILALVRPGQAAIAPSPAEAAATATSPADEPVDWRSLEAAFPGREDFIDQLCRILISSHAGTPEALRALARGGDPVALARLAHNLHGVAGNLMAGEVSRLATQVNQAIRAGDGQAGARALELASALARLLAAAEHRVSGTQPRAQALTTAPATPCPSTSPEPPRCV